MAEVTPLHTGLAQKQQLMLQRSTTEKNPESPLSMWTGTQL